MGCITGQRFDDETQQKKIGHNEMNNGMVRSKYSSLFFINFSIINYYRIVYLFSDHEGVKFRSV